MILKWIGKSDFGVKYNLLYKGSEHGFTSSQYHKRCDGKSPLLCIVESNHHSIFGGYTTKSSKDTTAGNCYVPDEESFIFSLTNY